MSSVTHITQVKESPEDSSHHTIHSDSYERKKNAVLVKGECHMKKNNDLIGSRWITWQIIAAVQSAVMTGHVFSATERDT